MPTSGPDVVRLAAAILWAIYASLGGKRGIRSRSQDLRERKCLNSGSISAL